MGRAAGAAAAVENRGRRGPKVQPMVPQKLWILLDTLECPDVYRFLGVDRNARLEDLRAAAEKKYVSTHNQSSRNVVARAAAELAGLCKSDIFRNARTKAAYDRELDRRDPGRQAAATEQRRQALARVGAAIAAASDQVVRYSGRISATGAVLMVSGTILATGFDAPSGAPIHRLGILAFPCGFTALLYRGPQRHTAVVAAAGLLLVVIGIVAQAIHSSLTMQNVAADGFLTHVLGLLRLAGGLALLSALASFVFRQSWHISVRVAARPFMDWWLATMAITGNPLIMAGVTGVAFALIFGLTAGVVMSFLFGGGAEDLVQGAASAIAWASGFLIVAGVFRRYYLRR